MRRLPQPLGARRRPDRSSLDRRPFLHCACVIAGHPGNLASRSAGRRPAARPASGWVRQWRCAGIGRGRRDRHLVLGRSFPGVAPMDDRAAQRALTALERYREGPPKHPRRYPDLHEHVLALARAALLAVVDEPINKDTEMHPLVRWQYRGGIAEPNRKAFMFTQPTDGKGRRYGASVLVAGLAASRDVYRVGFGKPLEVIGATWINAIANPVAPRLVVDGPCQ